MTTPETNGVGIPDHHGRTIVAWKTISFVSLGLAIAGWLSFLVLMFVALYSGDATPVTVILAANFALMVLGFVGIAVVATQQGAQRNDLADALTRAGHPGVDVRRLQAGRPVPSPQNLELRLRKERDDAGRRWLLVDAYAYAPPTV
ncbi:hypothetical protein IT072_13555 [Leifsonia sp. ZF2019]|uniref:hypothetical protein n=1 Tax=Leifsonia sp. ZF2019 TaxID=2781978 RepID=UPI001CBB6ACD|nr:hypothetical protein [Leifsonia sp. ZF2019]UAJ78285.1 hypothetical protein IT072_13555 [Leifsonia sp. ZF2019]